MVRTETIWLNRKTEGYHWDSHGFVPGTLCKRKRKKIEGNLGAMHWEKP
jgi:hypothetical protein